VNGLECSAPTLFVGAQRVGAIELLTVARTFDLRVPLKSPKAAGAVRDRSRKTVAGTETDCFLSPKLEAAVQFVQRGNAID